MECAHLNHLAVPINVSVPQLQRFSDMPAFNSKYVARFTGLFFYVVDWKTSASHPKRCRNWGFLSDNETSMIMARLMLSTDPSELVVDLSSTHCEPLLNIYTSKMCVLIPYGAVALYYKLVLTTISLSLYPIMRGRIMSMLIIFTITIDEAVPLTSYSIKY